MRATVGASGPCSIEVRVLVRSPYRSGGGQELALVGWQARDRLFQFEMWRRQATGTVAEILGTREVERDRGARLHQFRGDLDDELSRYHPHGKLIIESFTRGINTYIAETERNPALLPIEFRMLGITPGRWTPAVVISRHQALNANVSDEVPAIHGIGRSDEGADQKNPRNDAHLCYGVRATRKDLSHAKTAM